MFFVVSYDIVDNRRRVRVSNILEGYGQRVQKSVFEVEVSAAQHERMAVRVLGEVDRKEDSVRYYHVCKECRGKIRIQGLGTVHANPPFYFVGGQ